MKRSEFLETFVDAVQVEEAVTEDSVLANIEEWDSLAAVTLLALYNKKLGLKVQAEDVKSCKTVKDLLDIGSQKYDG